MSFFRYEVPTYHGGLPAGYAYINNRVAGTPALVDGVLAAGPHAGSYFIGYGEDARSAATNRGLATLAKNTDHLDDLLHRDTAVLQRIEGTAVGPVNSVTLPVETFVGDVGVPNTVAGILTFIRITDDQDNDLSNSAGARVVVSAIAGAAPGDGFSTASVTATISPAIPDGANYRIYYATRADAGELPPDVHVRFRLPAGQTPYNTQTVLRGLHGNNLAWNAGWTSTIYDLALSGINERYSRATAAVAVPPDSYPIGGLNLNVAGAGGWWIRTGPAMSGYSKQEITGTTGRAQGSGHAAHAIWFADGQDAQVNTPPILGEDTARVGGTTTGFAYYGTRRFTRVTRESAQRYAPGFAGVYVGQKQAHSSGAAPAGFRTWLPAGTAAEITGGVLTVLGSAFVARVGGLFIETAIAAGQDLLEVTEGGVSRTYLVAAVISPTDVVLRCLDGSVPDFGAAVSVTVSQWIRTTFAVYDGASTFRNAGAVGDTYPVNQAGAVFADPPRISATGGDEIEAPLDAGSLRAYAKADDALSVALAWGGFDDASYTGYLTTGRLKGDGGVEATRVEAETTVKAGRFFERVQSASGGVAATLGVTQYGPLLWTEPSGASSVATVTLTGLPTSMDTHRALELKVIIRRNTGNLMNSVAFVAAGYVQKWSDPDDALLSPTPTAGADDVFTGQVINDTIYWSVKRY